MHTHRGAYTKALIGKIIIRRIIMAIFVIGDLHLSFGCDKPMDIFKGWEGYQQRLYDNWHRVVGGDDTVVLAGDTSWGMSLAEAAPDFKWINALPGKQKLILKGNHDYWWGSMAAMRRCFEENSLTTLDIIHNNSFSVGGINICGSRGWLFETGQAHDEKIINREAMRLEASLKSADPGLETILFLHYPPAYKEQEMPAFLELMRSYGIDRCYYGHIHGAGHRFAIDGRYKGVDLRLIAADYIDFCPEKIEI